MEPQESTGLGRLERKLSVKTVEGGLTGVAATPVASTSSSPDVEREVKPAEKAEKAEKSPKGTKVKTAAVDKSKQSQHQTEGKSNKKGKNVKAPAPKAKAKTKTRKAPPPEESSSEDSSSSDDSADDCDSTEADTDSESDHSRRRRPKKASRKKTKSNSHRHEGKKSKKRTDTDSSSDSDGDESLGDDGGDQDGADGGSLDDSLRDEAGKGGGNAMAGGRARAVGQPGGFPNQTPPTMWNQPQMFQPWALPQPCHPVSMPYGNMAAPVPQYCSHPMQARPQMYPPGMGIPPRHAPPIDPRRKLTGSGLNGQAKAGKTNNAKRTRLEYKRVDQIWDSTIHNFKLVDTAETTSDDDNDGYVMRVRRTFDWEGKYKCTFVDVKSRLLRECLRDVLGTVKGISLVEEMPKLDPNMLFLYLEEFREHRKMLKTAKPSGSNKAARKKSKKRNKQKRKHLKVLLNYLDKDYAHIKKSLYPMLKNGLITFELLWALWKPDTLAFTTTYGSHDEPRVFKIESAEKHISFTRGEFYHIEGKYFEFDGKQFGYGSIAQEVSDFRGAQKITSLSCYPLKYHKNEAKLRKELIDRGKKFVDLGGVHYKCHQGIAYMKKKKNIVKIKVNGRVMVDPAIHRSVNPNYPVSIVRPKSWDGLSKDSPDEDDEDRDEGDDDMSEAGGCCGGSDSDEYDNTRDNVLVDTDSDAGGRKAKYVKRAIKGPDGKVRMYSVRTSSEDEEEPQGGQEVASLESESWDDVDTTGTQSSSNGPKPTLYGEVITDQEYLIASPVVLGFSFTEKLWLEFTVSGIGEISWNEDAYDSLVLEEKPKAIVRALVESHKYHAAESIDDVIQGKGKGLVAVLHGPPGTGKTLTAEGISELLKCPLYMVSAGELGTNSRFLEMELQRILDICHAWGAILLLDEADIFLEKRTMHDIHRNALVSIFLRQLEYFQGILFLTTNRVETFDDAFQSRIHVALRYGKLSNKAKRSIFEMFIERVRALEKLELMPFTDDDFEHLAKFDLNGRQIKNTVRTAQALAVNKGEALCMAHIKDVLEIQRSFDRDLKGGPGFEDAMHHYF